MSSRKQRTNRGDNSLFKAVRNKNLSKIRHHMKHNPQFVVEQDGGGNTPLHETIKLAQQSYDNQQYTDAKDYQKIAHYLIQRGQQSGFNPMALANNNGQYVLDQFNNQQGGNNTTDHDSYDEDVNMCPNDEPSCNSYNDESLIVDQDNYMMGGARRRKRSKKNSRKKTRRSKKKSNEYKKMTSAERQQMFSELGLELDLSDTSAVSTISNVSRRSRRSIR